MHNLVRLVWPNHSSLCACCCWLSPYSDFLRGDASPARQGLRKSHGENLERIHILQGGFTPELAIYVRLELLEGVVAYHSGQHEVARKSLILAQKKYEELQVSDEALALLAGMGFTAKESKRALRVSGQDVQRAVEFVMAEKARKKAKSEEDRKRQREHREQKKYGKTASGKPVDLKKLAELVSLGYDTRLAAESLRQSENDRESALDVLGNPALCDALKTSLKKKRLRRTVDEAELAELMLMGFEKERAGRALQKSLDVNEALEQLLRGEQLKPEEGASSIGPGTAGEAALGTDSQPNSPPVDSPILEERDREMEAEIAENLTGDPLAEYDIEVDKEGVAISEYLSLLDVKAS